MNIGLFKRKPDQIRDTVANIHGQVSKNIESEFGALKQECIDFRDLMSNYLIYRRHQENFFLAPNQNNFNELEKQFKLLQTSLKKITKESHNIEHMLSWLTIELNKEECLKLGSQNCDFEIAKAKDGIFVLIQKHVEKSDKIEKIPRAAADLAHSHQLCQGGRYF